MNTTSSSKLARLPLTRLPIYTAILLASLPAQHSMAQENGGAEQITEVVTYGSPIRDSQKAAIDQKRNADNYLDVVSADTIGRFPDQNLADSLGRMPGLAIERDQGQARYINFRGAPFRYTSLAIDGLTIPGAENGRVPRFDAFPAVITRAIEANKAVTPAMPGEAVSGYINIRTFDPFEHQGWSTSTDIGLGEQMLGDGEVSRYSARMSWSGETLGFSVFGSRNLREQITDNREMDLTLDPATQDITVNSIDMRNYKVARQDTAWGGRLEHRPEGSMNRYFYSALNSEFLDEEERNQYVFEFDAGAKALGGSVAPGVSGYQPLALARRMLEAGEYRNAALTQTLGADFTVGEWFMEARLNRTTTENELFLPIPLSAGGQVAASYDVSDLENPQVSLMAPFTQTPMSSSDIDYAVTLALVIDSHLDIDGDKIKLDAERNLSLFGQRSVLNTGFQFDRKEGRGVALAQSQSGFPASIDIDNFNTGKLWDTDMTNGIAGTVYDNYGILSAWKQAIGEMTVEPPADQLVSIDEDITALYAMTTTDFSWGNIVAGLRVENTDYQSTGPLASHADEQTHVLPSAHINIDLQENLKLRLAAGSSISRPTYTEWRAAASVNPIDQAVTGGNPTLDAEEALGLDASLEWYLGDASMLSAGLFHRSIDNVIYADSTTIDGGVYVPAAAGEQWQYTGFVNGKNGHLSGLEINLIAQLSDFLPGTLDGLGLTANVTALDSEFDTLTGNSFSLPGTSDLIYNTSVYYETERLSMRLNYQYRDDWMSTTENDSFAEYWAAQKRLDFNIKYDLPVQSFGADLSVYLNANNLNDAVDVRYVGTSATPNQVERYGRYYMAGIRASF